MKTYKLVLAGLLAASFLGHLDVLWKSRQYMAAGYGDFIIFYSGAEIIRDGYSHQLFDVATQKRYQEKFHLPESQWPMPFNHAPYELLIFLPFTSLPYAQALGVWLAANGVLLVIVFLLLRPYVDPRYRVLTGALLLFSYPTLESLRQGQDSILSGALLLAAFVALKRGKHFLAGVTLAAGLYKPQLVLPLAAVLLWKRQWAAVTGFVSCGLLLVALSLAMVGWQGVLDLLFMLRSMHDYSYIVYPKNMPNLRGLFSVALNFDQHEVLVNLAVGVASIALLAACLTLWKGRFDPGAADFDLKYSLTVLTTLLASYHLYSHDLWPGLLSLVLYANHVMSGRARLEFAGYAFLFLLLIFFTPFLPGIMVHYRVFGWGGLFFLAITLLLAFEVLVLNRERRFASNVVAPVNP